jgi:hypothetical protein
VVPSVKLHGQLVKMAERDMRSLHAEILWPLARAGHQHEREKRETLGEHQGESATDLLTLSVRLGG